MPDWLVLVLVFVGLGSCTVVCIVHDDAIEAQFMAECEKDRKHYECQERWRAGETHTQVVAVPVVVGR